MMTKDVFLYMNFDVGLSSSSSANPANDDECL